MNNTDKRQNAAFNWHFEVLSLTDDPTQAKFSLQVCNRIIGRDYAIEKILMELKDNLEFMSYEKWATDWRGMFGTLAKANERVLAEYRDMYNNVRHRENLWKLVEEGYKKFQLKHEVNQ